ncbi:MAG: hypothetical protein KC645_01485 [Gemmatimonadetes bacterium]|nr:hypothetical protein [Gemmatimonadota bacterium]
MFGSRKGASGAGTLLMIVAFLGIGGFMYWLNQTAVSAASAVVVEEEPEEEPTSGDGAVVTIGDFTANPAGYEGQSIRLQGIEIVSKLGNHAFWTKLTNDQPYLVRVGPTLMEGLELTSGGTATVTGTVRMMSDSVLDAWQAGGSFANDVNRIEAEFAESYIDATRVTAGAAAPADAAGSGS